MVVGTVSVVSLLVFFDVGVGYIRCRGFRTLMSTIEVLVGHDYGAYRNLETVY